MTPVFVETIAQYKPQLLILAGRSKSKVQATAYVCPSPPTEDPVGLGESLLTRPCVF